ncbi:hypothetical protein ACIGCK_04845 [Microbacterium sp. NPDC078428]|uniref:hypothetical protein n=1 Tax=Microbacterium sp. NPDC078428 TaxID=3364190 RepID=UPI0037CB949C
MNRYTAHGLVLHALNGEHIAIITPREADSTTVLHQLDQAAQTLAPQSVAINRKAGGHELTSANGGRVLITSAPRAPHTLTGIHLDAVHLEPRAHLAPETEATLTEQHIPITR